MYAYICLYMYIHMWCIQTTHFLPVTGVIGKIHIFIDVFIYVCMRICVYTYTYTCGAFNQYVFCQLLVLSARYINTYITMGKLASTLPILAFTYYICLYIIYIFNNWTHAVFFHTHTHHGRRRSDLKELRLPTFPTGFRGSPRTHQTRFHGSLPNFKRVFT